MKKSKAKGKKEKSDSENEGTEQNHTLKHEDVDQKLEEDFNMAVTTASRKQWAVISGLYSRQQGLLKPSNFARDACGSTTLVSRLKQHKTLTYHNGCVNTLHFNMSGDLLASGSDDLDIAIWDWAKSKKVIHYDSGHSSNVFQAKFMPYSNDSTLVTCARDGQVRVGTLSSAGTANDTRQLAQHRGAAHKLSIEPGSPWLFLTCGEDGIIYQMDLREDKAKKLFCCRVDEHKKVPLYTIFINPSNVYEFAVGGRDQYARIYDRRKAPEDSKRYVEPLKAYCPHHLKDNNNFFANITCLVYSHDGTEVLVSYNDEDIYLFDSYSRTIQRFNNTSPILRQHTTNTLNNGAEFIKKYKGHRNNATVKGVNFFGPRSEFVVSGSDCGNVFLWDKETQEIVQYMKGDETGVVNCLEPHPTALFLATSGLDHDVKIWAPLAKEPNNLSGLQKLIETNKHDREDDRLRPHDPISEHLIYLMMHHVHQRLRERRGAGEDDSDSVDQSEDDEDEDDDEDDLPGRVECSSS